MNHWGCTLIHAVRRDTVTNWHGANHESRLFCFSWATTVVPMDGWTKISKQRDYKWEKGRIESQYTQILMWLTHSPSEHLEEDWVRTDYWSDCEYAKLVGLPKWDDGNRKNESHPSLWRRFVVSMWSIQTKYETHIRVLRYKRWVSNEQWTKEEAEKLPWKVDLEEDLPSPQGTLHEDKSQQIVQRIQCTSDMIHVYDGDHLNHMHGYQKLWKVEWIW